MAIVRRMQTPTRVQNMRRRINQSPLGTLAASGMGYGLSPRHQQARRKIRVGGLGPTGSRATLRRAK